LEGLEATEVQFSNLNEERRIDAQYFKKKYLEEDSKRRHYINATLGNQAFITDGPHGYHILDENSPVAMLTAKCTKNWFADRTEADLISSETHYQNIRSSLEENDLILSTRGTVGLCALVEKEILPCNIDQDVVRISLFGHNNNLNPKYVLAYLNSCFGQDWIARNSTGMVQQGLSITKIRTLPVPVLSNEFQQNIVAAVDSALNHRNFSKGLMQKSETTLLRALNLENWQAPEPLSYIRNSRDAFAAGRLDAEHFQPKYRALVAEMSKSKHYRLCPLGSLSESLKYGCSDKLEYIESGKIFLRIADLDGNRFNLDTVLHVSEDTSFGEAELVEEDDVLISRSGTLGIAVPISAAFSGAVYGSYFIRTRPNKNIIHPEFLSLFINSFAGRLQVEEKNTGGVQTNLTIPAIESLLIPVGDMSWQMQFVEIVNFSLLKRVQSAHLLESAKRAVEIAIEDSEAAALVFLANACPCVS
jgi:type I restriction enzyme M protein